MSTPFRHAEPQSHCAICEAETSAACQRCARPGCATHLFGDPALCGECDVAIDSRDLRESTDWLAGSGALGAYVGSMVAIVSIGGTVGLVVSIAFMLVGGGGALAFAEHRARRERHRFAAERRSRLR